MPSGPPDKRIGLSGIVATLSNGSNRIDERVGQLPQNRDIPCLSNVRLPKTWRRYLAEVPPSHL